MKRAMMLAVLVCAVVAFATEADNKPVVPPANPAAWAWKPKKVTKEDKKGIEALYKASEDAWKAGDINTAAGLVDYPVFMVTDNAANNGEGNAWTKEAWIDSMKASFANMPKDVKRTSTYKYNFLTDGLAWVEETNTATVPGKNKETWKSGSLVINKDGKWYYKSMVEGGWGDMPKPAVAATPAPAPGTKTANAPAAPSAPTPKAPATK